jgi:hypothetical protein
VLHVVERDIAEAEAYWKLPLLVVAAAAAAFLLLILYTAYFFIWIPFVTIIACLLCLVLMAIAAIRKRKRQIISPLLAIIAFVAVAAALLEGGDALRSSLRWLLWSQHFKAELLAQPSPPNGELRHLEWDATGFAGVANSTLYVVFDPSDALASVTRSGKVAGVPCEILLARQLEKHWYAVRFYTDEEWGDCPSSSAARH